MKQVATGRENWQFTEGADAGERAANLPRGSAPRIAVFWMCVCI